MRPSKIVAVAGTTIPMMLAACSVPTTERPPNDEPPAVDNGGEPSNENKDRSTPIEKPPSPSSSNDVSAPAQRNEQIVKVPEDVLHTPLDLMMLMQQMRAQIVYKTKTIPEAHYEEVIRPSLVRQLLAAGFAPEDVEEILSDVDYSRRIQGLDSPSMQATSGQGEVDAR